MDSDEDPIGGCRGMLSEIMIVAVMALAACSCGGLCAVVKLAQMVR